MESATLTRPSLGAILQAILNFLSIAYSYKHIFYPTVVVAGLKRS
jgi:hypothetical protein